MTHGAAARGAHNGAMQDQPRPPPSRRTLALLAVAIGALTAVSAVATALSPTLLAEHPLVLVALEPRNRNLILTASRVDAVPFVVFATLRRVVSDPLYFALGHLYGQGAVRWIERRSGSGGRLVSLVERVFARTAPLMVFLFPGILVCVLAGAVRMRTRMFLLLNVSGTVAVVLALRLFSQRLEGPVGAIQDFNDANVGWLTALTVVLVVSWLAWQRFRGASEIPSVRDLEHDLVTEAEAETHPTSEPPGRPERPQGSDEGSGTIRSVQERVEQGDITEGLDPGRRPPSPEQQY